MTEDSEPANEYASTTTVESLNNQFYTNTPEIITTTTPTPSSSSVASSQSTRAYGSVRRRLTTTTATTSTTEFYTSTNIAIETSTTTQTPPHTQQTNSNPFSSLDTNVAGAATSDKYRDQHATSTVTNDQANDNADEVTATPHAHLADAAFSAKPKDTSSFILTKLTAPKITVTTSTTTSDINLTPFSTHSSTVDDDDDDKRTDPASTSGAFTVRNPVEQIHSEFGQAPTENEISSSTATFKPFLGIVSSPRPFSFAKRTRPTFIPTSTASTSTTTTSTTPASIPSNVVETVTTPSHVKVSPYAVGTRNFHSRFELNSIEGKNDLQSLSQRQVSDGRHDGDDNDEFDDVVNHILNDSSAATSTNIDRRHSDSATVTAPYTSTLSPSLSYSSSSSATTSTTTSTDANANSAFAFTFSSSAVNRSNLSASHVHDEPQSTLHLVSKLPEMASTQRISLESRQRTRPRPTNVVDAAAAPPQSMASDNDRIISYNIVHQSVRPSILSATREETLVTDTESVVNSRSSVNRGRGFRPNLADLLRESSNGLPGTQGLGYERPESDLNTAIDSSQRRQQSNHVWTERLIPAEVTSELPTVNANGEISYRPQRTRPTHISTTAAPETTTSVERNGIRSRTRTSTSGPASVPTLVPTSELRESINIAADQIEPNKSVRFSLGRKIGLNAAADNRLNPSQRKRVGDSIAKEGGDSPIIFIHPRHTPVPTTTASSLVDTTRFVAVTEAQLAVVTNKNSASDDVQIRNSVIGVRNIINGLISSVNFGTNVTTTIVEVEKSALDLASTTEETKSPEKGEMEKSVSTVQTINRGTRPPTQTSSENVVASTDRHRRPPSIRRRPSLSIESSSVGSQNIDEYTRHSSRRRPVYDQRTTELSESGEIVNAGRGKMVYRGRVRARIGANAEQVVGNDAQQRPIEQTQTSSVASLTNTEQNASEQISTESTGHESVKSTTSSIDENESNSSSESARRIPPYSARIIEDSPNEFDSLFALRRHRPVFGRMTSTTEANVEVENAARRLTATDEEVEKSIVTGTGEKRVRIVKRRRRPIDARTKTTNTTQLLTRENVETESVVTNGEDSKDRFQSIASRSAGNNGENLNVTKTGEKRVHIVARRRRPVNGQTRTTVTTENDETRTIEENGEEEIRQQVLVRRRPVYGRQRTSSSAAGLILKAIPEQTIQNEENATSVRVNTSRRRLPLGRQRTSTESALAVAVEEEIDQNVVSRRRPVYGRTRTTQVSSNEYNESGSIGVSGENENTEQRFQLPGLQSSSIAEEAETGEKHVQIIGRRRRPVYGRTRTTVTSENDEIRTVEKNGEEEIRQQTLVRRRPVYGRQRTSSSAASLILNATIQSEENVTSVRVNALQTSSVAGEERTDQNIVSRRRPAFGRTRTTSATSSESAEENSQRRTVGKTRTVVVRRRRPVSTTTTEPSNDDFAMVESNDEVTGASTITESQTEQATENISNGEFVDSVQTTTARLRPKYGRRKTPIEASAVEVENVKPTRRRPAFGRTRLRATTSTKTPVESEVHVEEKEQEVKSTRYRSRGQRPTFGGRRTSTTTSTTETILVENSETEQNERQQLDAVTAADVDITSTDASIQFDFGTAEPSEAKTTSENVDAITVTSIEPTTARTKKIKTYRRLRTTTKSPENVPENEKATVSVDEVSQQSTLVQSTGRRRIRKLRKFRKQNQTIAVDGQSSDGEDGSKRDARTQLIRTSNQLHANSLDAENGDEVRIQNDVHEETDPTIRPRPFKPKYRPSRPSFSLTSNTESNEDDSKPKPFRPRFTRPSRPSFSLKRTTAAPDAADIESGEYFSSADGINLFHHSDEDVDQLSATPRIEIESVNRFVPHAKTQPFRPKNPEKRPKFGKNRFTPTQSAGVDSLDVDALANRNKQIFSVQSKKHNILKFKQIQSAHTESNVVDELSLLTTTYASVDTTEVSGGNGIVDDTEFNTNTQSITVTNGNSVDGEADVDDNTTTTQSPNSQSRTEQSTEQDGDASDASTLAPDALSINLIDILQGTTVRPIRKLPKFLTTTTTTAKPTTFHHVFAIDYDESTGRSNSRSNAIGGAENAAEVISKRVEKLAEVNRIVEVYSKQSKQTLKHHQTTKPETSNLVIERLPTFNKLGEVSRITLIKLVDRNNDSKTLVPDFLGFLTTTPSPNAVEAAAQHSVQSQSQEKKGRQIVLPESIFSVETSTIPLEGLFQTERNGKKLNIVYATTLDEATRQSSLANDRPSPVYVPSTTPSTVTVTAAATTTTPQTELRPVSLPINNDSSPLVISIANLDSVVLSKVTTPNNHNNNVNRNNIDTNVVESTTTSDGADATTIITTPPLSSSSSAPSSNDNNTPITEASATIVAIVQPQTPDGNGNDGSIAASSGKVSTIVDAPSHTTQVVGTTVVAPLPSVDPSVVNTQTSYSSEITKSKVKVSQLNELKPILAPTEVDHDKVSQS